MAVKWFDGPLGLARNPYTVDGSTVVLELTQGQHAKVDLAAFSLVCPYRWHAHRDNQTYYAESWCGRATKSKMHSFLRPDWVRVDHEDGNGLNNTGANMRPATANQNKWNTRLAANNTSGFKGVSRHVGTGKWCAQIKVFRRQVYLGAYATAEEAACAYDRAAVEHFGAFALTNERLGLFPTPAVLPELMAAD